MAKERTKSNNKNNRKRLGEGRGQLNTVLLLISYSRHGYLLLARAWSLRALLLAGPFSKNVQVCSQTREKVAQENLIDYWNVPRELNK